jgi:hypothetical protein
MDTVYVLEDRCFRAIYHWFFLILAGLRHLENSSTKVNICMPWFVDYRYNTESLEYFKDKFNFFFDLKSVGPLQKIPFHGEPLLQADTVSGDAYRYIRNLLLKGKSYTMIPKKYVYITRKGSEKIESNNGRVHHAVVNESELRSLLSKYGFEVIQLEDFNLEEKIKIFREAEVIVSPFGGGLTFTALCEPTQKVIELVSPHMPLNMRHYEVICKVFNIPYTRFMDVETIDTDYNILVNIESLLKILMESNVLFFER